MHGLQKMPDIFGKICTQNLFKHEARNILLVIKCFCLLWRTRYRKQKTHALVTDFAGYLAHRRVGNRISGRIHGFAGYLANLTSKSGKPDIRPDTWFLPDTGYSDMLFLSKANFCLAKSTGTVGTSLHFSIAYI